MEWIDDYVIHGKSLDRDYIFNMYTIEEVTKQLSEYKNDLIDRLCIVNKLAKRLGADGSTKNTLHCYHILVIKWNNSVACKACGLVYNCKACADRTTRDSILKTNSPEQYIDVDKICAVCSHLVRVIECKVCGHTPHVCDCGGF